MSAESIGRIAGRMVTFGQKRWRNNRTLVLRLVAGILLVYALPPATQYWLSHVRFPDVPVSAIFAMLAAATMLLALAIVAYVGFHFLRQIPIAERTVVVNASNAARRSIAQPETAGSFVPVTDTGAWAQEQLLDLERKGILTKTDRTEVEELAEEMGMAAAQRRDKNNGVKRAE